MNITVELDSSYLKHVKRLRVHVSISFIAKDIAILRLSLTGGDHLEFYHEQLDEKKETVSFQLLRVNISETLQILKT